MLLAYIDEVGEPGAFVSPWDKHYNTSPAFGYGGFLVPEDRVRDFGAIITESKRRLFKTLYEEKGKPGSWEVKGASMFRKTTSVERPQNIRVFSNLVSQLCTWGGSLFYYADEKPIGTAKQTQLNVEDRERRAMFETLNRLCRHADTHDSNLLVMIDQINEKTRAERLPRMYGHILARSAEKPEMKRIIEPPMHVDSELSACIQFADWVAAAVGRGLDYQLVKSSDYRDTATSFFNPLRRSFTHESKLHLNGKSIDDLVKEDIFRWHRPLHVQVRGQRIADDPKIAGKMYAVHQAASQR